MGAKVVASASMMSTGATSGFSTLEETVAQTWEDAA
jgi:hypothetical protein